MTTPMTTITSERRVPVDRTVSEPRLVAQFVVFHPNWVYRGNRTSDQWEVFHGQNSIFSSFHSDPLKALEVLRSYGSAGAVESLQKFLGDLEAQKSK